MGPAECALVSCVSNKAIDAIAEKFVRRLPFIVVGRDERVGPTARQWTLEAQVNRDPEVAHWQAAKDELLEHDKTLELNKDDSPSRQEATAASLLKKLEDSTLQALQICAVETRRRAAAGPMFSVLFALVGETLKVACEELSKNKRRASLAIRRACRAVLTTIDSCGTAIARLDEDGDLVDDAETRCIADRLALAVLDEAGTITEAKLCVIIAVLPQITRIVSIGDQQQLEPYTDIQMNIQKRLRDTQGYFHRAARVLRDDIPMLHTQFRMHPKICKLVSSIAYGGQLHTDPAVARKRETASGARAISWKGYAREGAGESKSAGGSFFNDQELKIVCDLAIHEVSVLRPQNKRLLIITFYREQLNLLRKELADMGVLARDGKTGLPVDPDDGHVRVATVDSAQGSEADCVILSMVRCNERCDVGFLANQNRAIVAISRAKDRLIIVGHKETVAARGLWRRILNEAEGTGARGGGIGGALGSIDSTRINGRMQQGQRGGPGGQMRDGKGGPGMQGRTLAAALAAALAASAFPASVPAPSEPATGAAAAEPAAITTAALATALASTPGMPGFAEAGPNIGQLRCGPCGTETYMAPEMHTALSYDGCKADVFALGVCLYTLANKSPPCVMIPQDMTAASLAAAPPEQQKQLLGERLFPLISQVQPAFAGKITGMLLEMDNGELLNLLESPEALNAKIMEAVSVLEMHAAEGDVSPSQQIIVSKRSELEPANLAPVAQALAPPVAADHPLARRLRIVRKKLREIAVLEQLEAVEGAVLQANQRAKIQEKSALEAELASLVTE